MEIKYSTLDTFKQFLKNLKNIFVLKEDAPTKLSQLENDAGYCQDSLISKDKFSKEKTYKAGSFCIENNTLYKFKLNKSPGEWSDVYVKETTVDEELKELQEQLDKAASAVRALKELETLPVLAKQYASRR